jgi:hypothetical protein
MGDPAPLVGEYRQKRVPLSTPGSGAESLTRGSDAKAACLLIATLLCQLASTTTRVVRWGSVCTASSGVRASSDGYSSATVPGARSRSTLASKSGAQAGKGRHTLASLLSMDACCAVLRFGCSPFDWHISTRSGSLTVGASSDSILEQSQHQYRRLLAQPSHIVRPGADWRLVKGCSLRAAKSTAPGLTPVVPPAASPATEAIGTYKCGPGRSGCRAHLPMLNSGGERSVGSENVLEIAITEGTRVRAMPS